MSLGVKRGTVSLVPYQPEWEQLYEQEREVLSTIFGSTALDIQHIGSTSVAGLAAKPLLDMAIRVARLPIGGAIVEQLWAHNYGERVNRLGPGQLVYVKGREECETHFLHIIPDDNPDWHHKLQFRDYLRTHPEAVKAYEALKKELSRAYGNQRSTYTHLKGLFIQQVLLRIQK